MKHAPVVYDHGSFLLYDFRVSEKIKRANEREKHKRVLYKPKYTTGLCLSLSLNFWFTVNYNPLTKFYVFKIFYTHLIYVYDISEISHHRYDNVILS